MPKLRILAPSLLALLLTPALCLAADHPSLPADLSVIWVVPFVCM